MLSNYDIKSWPVSLSMMIYDTSIVQNDNFPS